jgi:hypothetical protein
MDLGSKFSRSPQNCYGALGNPLISRREKEQGFALSLSNLRRVAISKGMQKSLAHEKHELKMLASEEVIFARKREQPSL